MLKNRDSSKDRSNKDGPWRVTPLNQVSTSGQQYRRYVMEGCDMEYQREKKRFEHKDFPYPRQRGTHI